MHHQGRISNNEVGSYAAPTSATTIGMWTNRNCYGSVFLGTLRNLRQDQSVWAETLRNWGTVARPWAWCRRKAWHGLQMGSCDISSYHKMKYLHVEVSKNGLILINFGWFRGNSTLGNLHVCSYNVVRICTDPLWSRSQAWKKNWKNWAHLKAVKWSSMATRNCSLLSGSSPEGQKLMRHWSSL